MYLGKTRCPNCNSNEEVVLLSTTNKYIYLCEKCQMRFATDGEVMKPYNKENKNAK